MAMRIVLMCVVLAALVCGGEIEDSEQKKRGAGKATSLNAIPTGAQKPEYTYSIYQNQPQSNSPSPTYQNQVPNSFYPTQGASQYYTTNPTETSAQYPAQPQLNLLPPPTTSQFVPLNFVPNPGYQAKYQIIPSKTQNGNIQLAIVPQQQAYASPSIVPYHQLFSPSPQSQINPQHNIQAQFGVAQNYQLPANPYLSHPSMFLLAQPSPSLYNNLVYPNPVQSFYNYYTPNTQAKYNNNPSIPAPSSEYEKIQGPVSQSISKEDSDLSGHSTEYITNSDSSSYKNAYSAGRPTYSKL